MELHLVFGIASSKLEESNLCALSQNCNCNLILSDFSDLNSKLDTLAASTGKNVDLVRWKCSAHSMESFSTKRFSTKPKEVGKWLQQLICLVPIQIARADANKFHGNSIQAVI